jgi:hypothetical protein
MYYLLGPQTCTVRLLESIGLAPSALETATVAELRAYYVRWLAQVTGEPELPLTASPLLVESMSTTQALLRRYIEPASLDPDLAPITDEVVDRLPLTDDPVRRAWNLEIVGQAMHLLSEREPQLAALFWIFVVQLFHAQVPGNIGGSTARAIGTVWVNIPRDATVEDVAEFLVHELTHQLIFVDSLAAPHLSAAGRRASATSAIRGTERPLTCVVDSVFVALEVMRARHAYGLRSPKPPRIHPDDRALLAGAVQTIRSVRATPAWQDAFTHEGLTLFKKAQLRVAELAELTC